MRTLRLGLFVVLVTSTTMIAACANSGDDDDDGFTVSPTPTVSPSPTGGTPTPTPPAQPITERSSFIAGGGTELWLCLEAQFDGQITKVHTEDSDTPANCVADVVVGETYTVAAPTFTALRIDGLTGCDVNNHNWFLDYVPVPLDRCEGPQCVKQHDFVLDAGDTFGALCGSTGVGALTTVITDMGAYLSATTGLHRFHVTAGNGGSVSISKILVYATGGGTKETDCTTTATISSGSTGLFDTTCTPDPTANPLATGNYDAIIFGEVNGQGFIGVRAFDYEPTPAP